LPLSAIETGFFDQSHIIRHFRDSLGVTPGEYAVPARTPQLDGPTTGRYES
jgi:transcriptional regulator GlxA family with amidase domain